MSADWWGKVSGINRTRVGDHPNTCRRSPEEEMTGFTRNNTQAGGPEVGAPEVGGPVWVRPPGFEPGTCGLRVRCSAIELEARRRSVGDRSPESGRVRDAVGVTEGT
jgi:hypothetical protein